MNQNYAYISSELLVELGELYPFMGRQQIHAELRIVDALRKAAEDEREACVQLILARIARLQMSENAYSRNAANQLKEVVQTLRRRE